jgi:hypothetical protein
MNMKYMLSQTLRKMPAHTDIIIPKSLIPNPEAEGFRRTLGEPRGQKADYELTLEDGKRIHLLDYGDHYKAHWDWFSPLVDLIKHLLYDSPHWLVVGIIAAGIGSAILMDSLLRKS